MGSEEDTYNIIFQALKHPIRRRILRQLDNQPTTFTGLLNELGIDNGLLNYHLNNLNSLISKGTDEKYRLSDFGAATLTLTKRVEEPARPEETTIKILDKKIPVNRLLAITLIILLASNIYSAYTIQTLSNDNLNALGWTLTQTRNHIRETNSILSNSLETGKLELAAAGVIQRDMIDASRYLRISSILDKEHREQWDTLGHASDDLAQAMQQVASKMASYRETSINISSSQEYYIQKIHDDLTQMEKAFPVEMVIGSKPKILFNEEQITLAAMTAYEFDTGLDGLYDAFGLGTPFTVRFGEDYLWIEDE